jgi:lysophospholipase L1-like esterase
MYRFQVRAHTQTGESIALVGETPELGGWDVTKAIALHTNADRYPLWETDGAIDLSAQRVEYKYVRLVTEGEPQWEVGANRWVPMEPQAGPIMVVDGEFDWVQPYPFGYLEQPAPEPSPPTFEGLKIVVIGSSVAVGHNAWLFNGWAKRLGQRLKEKYDHQLVNVSKLGSTVGSTLDRFNAVVTPEQPDIVIIALSLGNEGLAHCAPQARRAAQRRFESGLQQLIKLTRQLGARPMLGAVYPHGDYTPEHYALLQDTHQRMLTWGVPILDWLGTLSDRQGRWKPDLSFDPAHPNSQGHRLMYHAIDLSLFQIDKAELIAEQQRLAKRTELPIYIDPEGFELTVCREEKRLHISNPSAFSYSIAPYWQELQTALQGARLIPGLYIANQAQTGVLPYFSVGEDGAIETTLTVPPGSNLEYTSAFDLFSPSNSQVLFYDGHLGILREDEQNIWIINESDHPFNVHPMWREVRNILKALPQGIYEDPLHRDRPFSTMMIGPQGLESRVKIAAKSAMLLRYSCQLSDRPRVAILPLGDRCAVRMLLHKLDYDGPAFPFDLTRTTSIADVADIIANQFADMWNPELLTYSAEAGRIYHGKWSGLSFAHEVEDWENPEQDMTPIYDRMRSRYEARAVRFGYTLDKCDQVLFVRTGIADRAGAIDLVDKLEEQCQEKPFQLLLLSPQDSAEFVGLDQVVHHNVTFNPDVMCADLGHWLHCAEIMRSILDGLGVSSKNLFWCPPTTPSKVLG